MGVSTAARDKQQQGFGWEPLDVEAAAALAASSSVAVMAPALTEGGPQKPENLLSSLPAAGFLSPEQATQVCQNREVLAKFVVSANVQPTKIDERCLRGISKDLIRDVINSKYGNGIENLSVSNLIPHHKGLDDDDDEDEDEEDGGGGGVGGCEYYKNELAFLEDERGDLPSDIGYSLDKSSNTIMNEPSMGDQPDNMGFLKTNVDLPLAADKSSAAGNLEDVDQIIAFDPEMSAGQCNMGNVEEILRVIKSLDSVASGANDPGQSSADPSEIFPMPEEGFSSFDRELLNDVHDVIGLCNDNINIIDPVEQQSVIAEGGNSGLIQSQQALVAQKQFETERRCAFLMRRLRKLQAKIVGCHVAEENTAVLEAAHASAKQSFFQELQDMGTKTNMRNFPEISRGNLESFLQKMEKSCSAQSNSVNRQRAWCRYFGAGSRDALQSGASASSSGNHNTRHSPFGMPRVKVKNEEVEAVAGPLESQLHILQNNLDSDCTASSSGGESCDEMQTFNNPHQQRLPISKRAAWRYAQDRAGIASRWSWLQAQISDLEYKIRQHNDLQRQVRASKSMAVLDNAETVNGYSGVLPGQYNAQDTEATSSRTRPFAWSAYQKRKLLQLDRLHEASKKAARASTIKCECDGTLPFCALCTGRHDPTQPQEPLEQLSVQERVALVDPGFHPFLSFPDEILHGTHLDAIMKAIDWQQKMLRGNIRMSRMKDKESNERRNKKLTEHRTKYTSRVRKPSSSSLTARIKRKVLKGKRNRMGHERSIHGLSKKRVAKLATSMEDDEEASVLSSSSKHSSPVPSPLQHTTASSDKNPVKDKTSFIQGRSRQNSYDIDNIVIPYSVAASTRLEKLQYKEILTPKWRLCEEPSKIDVKNGVVHRPSQDSDYEDVSDETIVQRHERSEREENKRFMTFAKMPHQLRIRHSRRTDSRADSGANTPDPMSPHASDFGGDLTSPIISPPATPLQVQDMENQNQTSVFDMHRTSSLHSVFRRRTNSSVRSGKEDAGTCMNEEEHEIVLPYDARTFPLSEDVYDKMLEMMPDGYWLTSSASMCSREDKIDDDADTESHESDTTESVCCDVEGEDPNDPEWTVADDRDTEKDRIRLATKR